MTDNDSIDKRSSDPSSSRGSINSSQTTDCIDIDARLRAIEKQRRIILEATDDERIERCMRMVGSDLVATRRDFRRASELLGTPEATHQRLLTGGEGDGA